MEQVFVIKIENGASLEIRAGAELGLAKGDICVFKRDFYEDLGEIVRELDAPSMTSRIEELPPALRQAGTAELASANENFQKVRNAMPTIQELITRLNLQMSPVNAHYSLDCKLLTVQFCADGRVDFRELVRDLAGVFKTRIELRQIGVRDESKMMGGLGICGRQLCCNLFLSDFVPVSIKMAKEQNLSLNPTKISGTCGRLMCCLKHEQEAYESIMKNTPGVGSLVKTPDGKGQVTAVSPLKGIVTVAVEEGEEKNLKDYKVDDLKILKKVVVKNEEKIDMAELKKLEKD